MPACIVDRWLGRQVPLQWPAVVPSPRRCGRRWDFSFLLSVSSVPVAPVVLAIHAHEPLSN
jgi:hypothetical protein